LMLNSSVSHEPATRQIAARREETQILAIPEAIPSTHRELRPPEPTGSVRYYYRQVLHTQSQCCTVTHNSQSIADSRVGECLVQRPSYPSMRKRALVLTTQTSSVSTSRPQGLTTRAPHHNVSFAPVLRREVYARE